MKCNVIYETNLNDHSAAAGASAAGGSSSFFSSTTLGGYSTTPVSTTYSTTTTASSSSYFFFPNMLISLVPNYFDLILAFKDDAPELIAAPALPAFSLIAAPAFAVFSFISSLVGIFYLAFAPKLETFCPICDTYDFVKSLAAASLSSQSLAGLGVVNSKPSISAICLVLYHLTIVLEYFALISYSFSN